MESNYEDYEVRITVPQVWRVVQNVFIALSVLLFVSMCIVGGVCFNRCPSEPMLAIYLIVQGATAVSLPLLYLAKYRWFCAEEMSTVTYYSVFSFIAIVSIGWLIAGTHWMTVSGCPDSALYRSGIAFLIFLWLASGITIIVLSTKLTCYLVSNNGYERV